MSMHDDPSGPNDARSAATPNNEEELMAGLMAALIEEDASIEADPRFEQLAAGDLSAEARAALEEEAMSTPEGRVAWIAAQPLDEVTKARIAAAVDATQGRPRSWRWAGAAAAVLAAAALLFVVTRSGPPPIPHYDLELKAGSEVLRGDTAQGAGAVTVRLGAGERVKAVLRPRVAAATPIEARAFWAHSGASAVEWNVPLKVAASGAVMLDGEVDALFAGVMGDVTVTLCASAAGHLPSASQLDSAEGVRCIERTVTVTQ